MLTFSSNDQEFFTPELKALDRKRKRIYSKQGRSTKWKKLNSNFKKKVRKAKKVFYKKMISDLKKSNPGQWYSKLKRMTAYDQHKNEEIIVNEIRENTDQQQADIIADKFSSVSNIYDPIQKENISFTNSSNCSPQFFTPSTVLPFLRNIKTNKATVKDDISAN